jgi:hypothetical protein
MLMQAKQRQFGLVGATITNAEATACSVYPAHLFLAYFS